MPELLAAATPSVLTSFKKRPPRPRLFVNNVEKLTLVTNRLFRIVTMYYLKLESKSMEDLKVLASNKVDGILLSQSGSKQEQFRTFD